MKLLDKEQVNILNHYSYMQSAKWMQNIINKIIDNDYDREGILQFLENCKTSCEQEATVNEVRIIIDKNECKITA